MQSKPIAVIELTDEMRQRLGDALQDGCPVIAASVQPDGYPKLSFYGSTQVYSADQLAIWHRDPEGGLIERLPENPRVAFMYRHPQDRVFWQFFGRGRVVDDPEVRDAVYENMPPIEQMLDSERRGRAIIIDLDRVVGRGVDMRRDEIDLTNTTSTTSAEAEVAERS